MIPPSFLPPSTPRPMTSYIRMGTREELARAITPLAVFVSQGLLDYSAAVDLLVRSFVLGPWSGRSIATVMQFETRAQLALSDSIERYEAYGWNATGTPGGDQVSDDIAVI